MDSRFSTGGNDTPFITYSTDDKGPGTSMLVMEILDVKQAPWPEPTAKVFSQYLSTILFVTLNSNTGAEGV